MRTAERARPAAIIGLPLATAVAVAVGLAASSVTAQTSPPATAPLSAKQSAPIDLTGQWVSIVNEDWRWRMLTPRKGDYSSVPLNDEGRRVADTWTPAAEGSCKAYGTGGLMRMPLRVRIDWQGDNVLRLETDSGRQVRELYFSEAPPMNERTLGGHSTAQWRRALASGDGWGFGTAGQPPAGGSLHVVTTHLEAGWLRRNGVPYSENAQVTEYYDRFRSPDDSEWFVVTTIVDDPQYLREPYVTSSHFRRERNSSTWNPSDCKN